MAKRIRTRKAGKSKQFSSTKTSMPIMTLKGNKNARRMSVRTMTGMMGGSYKYG